MAWGNKFHFNWQEVLVVKLQATGYHVLSSFLQLPLADCWEPRLYKKIPVRETQSISQYVVWTILTNWFMRQNNTANHLKCLYI